MNANGILNVAGAIVTVALVTTIVTNPTSVQDILAIGGAFGYSLKSAMGR